MTISLAATLLAICFILPEEVKNLRFALLILALVAKALSRCSSQSEKMVLTKDWLVILTEREDKNSLSEKNSTMSIIDQITLIIAPIISGYLCRSIGSFYACFVMLTWNLVSWVVERYLLIRLYKDVKGLSMRVHVDKNKLLDAENQSTEDKVQTSNQGVIRTFCKQKTAPAAMALAMLYLTVLSFDGV
uniref:Solute carrier family 40 member n=1 Tax=Acrobeloides nanus TaxID=290746 RepID=A0A914CF66_9BILA